MTLTPGARIGSYEIIELVGSGGMGQVYKARDHKLGRPVALKILPKALASDPKRRTRFEQEARTASSLDHPNIITIFDIAEHEDLHFIVMQYVEGETLRERMKAGRLELGDTLRIAIQIADGLSRAHSQGIVHRDLKPENIMIAEDGLVKIVDFGLAKLVEPDDVHEAETRDQVHLTQEGRILGTVAYMSPEQAQGKAVDARSDIFSLGSMLYEMVTGRRAFSGESMVSVLAAVVRDEPPPIHVPVPTQPLDLEKILSRALKKDPSRRFQSMADMRVGLQELMEQLESGEMLPATRPGIRVRLLVTGVLIVAVGVAAWVLRPAEPLEPDIRSAPLTRLTAEPGVECHAALSPDGRFLVYAGRTEGNWDIFSKRVGGERIINLTEDSTGDDFMPAFSPDGESIAFRSERDGGGIFLMGATGESVRRVTDYGYNPSFSPDGREIVFATSAIVSGTRRTSSTSELFILNQESGEVRLLSKGDAVQPSWSPDGHRIAYWSWGAPEGLPHEISIWTIPADGGEAKVAARDDAMNFGPVWAPAGDYLYFARRRGETRTLWRVPIDERSGETLGKAEPVTTGGTARHEHMTFSQDGQRLAFVETTVAENIYRIGFEPHEGTAREDAIPITRGSKGASWPHLSPDGDWIAFVSEGALIVQRSGGKGAEGRRVVAPVAGCDAPRWSPDGDSIAFLSDSEIWMVRRDGSGLRPVTQGTGGRPVWSPDGNRMAYASGKRSYLFDPFNPWEEQTPEALPPMPDGEYFEVVSWSPDGQWLAGNAFVLDEAGAFAYESVAIYSFETGEYQKLTGPGIWVRSQAPKDETVFGHWPRWLSDSRCLLFRTQSELFLVDRLSGDVKQVYSVAPDIFGRVSIARDDRTLYFSRMEAEADIWLLDLR